jgi:hypothetical protein
MQVADLACPASTVPAAYAEPVQPSTAASIRAANFAVMSVTTPKNRTGAGRRKAGDLLFYGLPGKPQIVH